MFKRHKWHRPRFKADTEPPVCTVCGLQSDFYFHVIMANGRVLYGGLTVDDGRMWGSIDSEVKPRAGFWCKGPKTDG